jgi:hypothetical protein
VRALTIIKRINGSGVHVWCPSGFPEARRLMPTTGFATMSVIAPPRFHGRQLCYRSVLYIPHTLFYFIVTDR